MLIYLYIYIYAALSNGKWKSGDFPYSFYLPFAYRANGSLSFVLLFTKKNRNLSVCKWNKRTCPSMNAKYINVYNTRRYRYMVS